MDGLNTPYDGYTDGASWNGWACPVFDRAIADRIAHDLQAAADRSGVPRCLTVVYDPAEDVYRVEEDGNDPVVFDPVDIEVDGRTLKVYALGTRYWTWEAA